MGYEEFQMAVLASVWGSIIERHPTCRIWWKHELYLILQPHKSQNSLKNRQCVDIARINIIILHSNLFHNQAYLCFCSRTWRKPKVVMTCNFFITGVIRSYASHWQMYFCIKVGLLNNWGIFSQCSQFTHLYSTWLWKKKKKTGLK